MPEAEERSRLPVLALGFAAAAAFSCWNPISAPFGLVVGLASLVIAIRAVRRAGAGRARALSASAVALAAGAVIASTLVLGLTAGVGRELGGMPVVPVPRAGEMASELDAAAERTRPARERARTELETLDRQEEGRAGERKPPARDGAGEPAGK